MSENIFRKQTIEEASDFIALGKKTFRDKYRDKLVQKQQEYTKMAEPYCFRCANIDFNDFVETANKEAQRRQTTIDEEAVIKVQAKKLDDYGDSKRFRHLGKKEAMDYERGSNHKHQVLTGYHHDYRCKERGCGISIFRPIKKEADKVADSTTPSK